MFQDWALVLSFIEKAVSTVWSKKANQGDSYNGKTDQTGTAGKEKLVKNMITAEKDWLLKTCKIPTKRRKIQNPQNEQLSAKSSLKPMEMLVEDGSLSLFQGTNRRGRDLLRNTANFGEAETDGEFPYQMDSSESRGAKKGILESSNHGHSVNALSTATYNDNFYEVPHSTCMDRRERNHRYSPSICCSISKSINIEAQMDGRRYEALQAYHTSGVTPSFPLVSSMSTEKGPKIDRRGCEAPERNYRLSRQRESSSRSKRSYSAPPICRAKRRFFSIVDYLISTADSLAVRVAPRACNATERGELEHSTDSPLFNRQLNERHEMSHTNESPFYSEQMGKETSNIMQISNRAQDNRMGTSSCNPGGLKPVQDTETSLIKWREDFQDGRLADIVNSQDVGDGSAQLKDENTILDIDSCMLHVAGDSLVPKSIDRSCLENANVLLQVDKKFIPVVAGGTLAVIDQHAADERIRLEEMRKKVLSGEMKSITYLEEEKDLALPEMAYQLLCNYAEHVQRWGWICNIFCQDSGSFNKDLNLLNRQPMHLSLLAVPCILGVDLSDADLLEFLEQFSSLTLMDHQQSRRQFFES